MKTLIAFMNAYSQGKSGSDVAFIEIAKRMVNFNKVVVTSQLGSTLCKNLGLQADFKITTREKEFKNVYLIYLQRIVKALLLRIDTADESILYATSDFLPDVLPALFLKLKNKRAKWFQKTFHLIPEERKIPYYLQKLSYCLIRKFADLTVVDNKPLRRELVKMGFDEKRIKVNYLGVDLSYFENLSADKNVSYEGVFLARLHQSKGIFDLVDIWEKVCRQMPYARLAIIGSGNQEVKKRLKLKIKSCQLDKNIDVLGYLENNKAFSLLKASQLFIFPSHEEGFGMVIAEAMACGVPIIAYDLPVYEKTFKKAMTIVPCFDKNLYAKKIIALLANKANYKKQRQKGFKLVKDFTWEKAVKREIEYLNNL